MKKVYVVLGLELGWDCVVGVFDADKVTKEALEKQFPRPEYIVQDKDVEESLGNW